MGSIDKKTWEQAYLRELRYLKEKTGPRQLNSIFFGGGTPSLMDVSTVEVLINEAKTLYCVSDAIEITLEANPTTLEVKKFQQFRQAGVNRLSLGVQSLKDSSLQFLGRRYTENDVCQAMKLARGLFSNLSFDLIYALPGQTRAQWEEELKDVLMYKPDHLSAYQLTIEEGTPFFTRHERGEFMIPLEDEAGLLYETTLRVLDKESLPAYEISNHAMPHMESKHNLSYWRYEDYAGIGPGAHGRLTQGEVKLATQQERIPEVWLRSIRDKGHGQVSQETLSPETQAIEALMMGLRLVEGVNLERLACPLSTVVDEQILDWLKDQGFLIEEGTRLQATLKGRQRLNAILSRLFL